MFIGANDDYAPNPRNVELVERALELSKAEQPMDRRMSRLWVARRSLGFWSVGRNHLPHDPLVRRLLTKLLAEWASVSAWMGLHGYLFLGQIDALSQLTLLTSDGKPTAEHSGGLSSAYYSTAKSLRGAAKLKMLWFALQHTHREHALPGDRHGVLAVRASILLSVGNVIGARVLYKKVLQHREVNGFQDHEIAEARVEWAFSLALTGQPLTALNLMREDITRIRHPGFKVRALRKAAKVAAWLRKRDEAALLRAEAREIALANALYDQLRQMDSGQ